MLTGTTWSTGLYTVRLNPQGLTGIVTATLMAAVPVSLTLDGPPVAVTTTRPGLQTVFLFARTPGQQMSYQWQTLASTGVGVAAYALTDPPTQENGAYFNGSGSTFTGDAMINPGKVASNYEIVCQPKFVGTSVYTVQLRSAVQASISIDGPSLPVNIPIDGQHAWITFNGNQGQNLSLFTTYPPNQTISDLGIVLYDSSGNVVEDPSYGLTLNINFDDITLPSTGQYFIGLNPKTGRTGVYTLTLSTPITRDLVVNGSPVVVTVPARPGQNVVLNTQVSQSQTLALAVNGQSAGEALVDVHVAGLSQQRNLNSGQLATWYLGQAKSTNSGYIRISPNINNGAALYGYPKPSAQFGTRWHQQCQCLAQLSSRPTCLSIRFEVRVNVPSHESGYFGHATDWAVRVSTDSG